MGIFVRQRGDVGGIGGIPVDSIFRQNHVSLNKKTVTLYYPAGEASKHGACKGFLPASIENGKKSQDQNLAPKRLANRWSNVVKLKMSNDQL